MHMSGCGIRFYSSQLRVLRTRHPGYIPSTIYEHKTMAFGWPITQLKQLDIAKNTRGCNSFIEARTISPPSGYVPKIEFSERKVLGVVGLHCTWLPVLVDFLLQYAREIETETALYFFWHIINFISCICKSKHVRQRYGGAHHIYNFLGQFRYRIIFRWANVWILLHKFHQTA